MGGRCIHARVSAFVLRRIPWFHGTHGTLGGGRVPNSTVRVIVWLFLTIVTLIVCPSKVYVVRINIPDTGLRKSLSDRDM